jgi:hypothetical protein
VALDEMKYNCVAASLLQQMFSELQSPRSSGVRPRGVNSRIGCANALIVCNLLGPVGMAGMYSSRGEVKAANAAKVVGIPFTLSTMGVCDVHEVAQKTGVPPWFQLYMLKDRGFVKSVIERSVSAGSKVLVFTVDLATPGGDTARCTTGWRRTRRFSGCWGS